MPSPLLGLHHVTVICGPAQQHIDTYAGQLGLRLVKQTVNFDDPGTYHLYFADSEARPGSVWTSFPWATGRRGRAGAGQATATAYAVSPGAVAAWQDALAETGDTVGEGFERFGETGLRLVDPDGLVIELIETPDASGQWAGGSVPTDRALGTFHSVTLCSRAPESTALLLTEAYGYRQLDQEGDRLRLVNDAAPHARYVDLFCEPAAEIGQMGTGTIHHVAFRAPTDEAELAVRETLLSMGLQPTPVIDRQYFRSVYTREPGGILFEIATDAPGFAVDEPADQLGQALKLPPQYETQRTAIEARLPPLRLP
ncbi:MAG: ring-cleaving dioxygenase [Rubricoccaceae bacterium]